MSETPIQPHLPIEGPWQAIEEINLNPNALPLSEADAKIHLTLAKMVYGEENIDRVLLAESEHPLGVLTAIEAEHGRQAGAHILETHTGEEDHEDQETKSTPAYPGWIIKSPAADSHLEHMEKLHGD